MTHPARARTPLELRSQAARLAASRRRSMAIALPHRLTRTQSRVLNFVSAFVADRGRSPSTREIVKAFGYNSRTAVDRILNILVRKGYLLRRTIPSYTELTLRNAASPSHSRETSHRAQTSPAPKAADLPEPGNADIPARASSGSVEGRRGAETLETSP